MEMQGQQEIAAEPAAVWAALLDAEVLRACVPGCQELTGTPDEGYEAVVVQKVGPVKATFRGTVELLDRDPPRAVTLSGAGKGGAAGFAKGEARVVLEPSGSGTVLGYDVQAKVGGKLAQLGSRVIDGFARKMADSFFENFKARVEGGPETAETDATETDGAA